MQNLKTQHQLIFSNPEQLFAEIVFSVLNVQNQFPGILDNHHRMNLIAKLLREKQWRTPKGFYNHWDIGQTYKLKLEKLDQIQQNLKQEEINNHIRPFNESLNDAENIIDYQNRLNPISPEVNHYQLQATLKPLKSEYREFSLLIATETRYLNDMEAQYLKNPSVIIKQIINSTAIKLAKLHDKIIDINQQIHQHQEAA